MEAGDSLINKTHRPKQAGAKVDKRKQSQRKDEAEKAEERGTAVVRNKSNKAFGVAKFGRLHKTMQRKLDTGHRKDHAPLVDRSTTTPPPLLVVVMGPPGSGKSTLIKVMARPTIVFYAGVCASSECCARDFWRTAVSMAWMGIHVFLASSPVWE